MKTPFDMSTMDKAKEAANEPTKPNSIFGVRHVQCALIFFALAVTYGLRVNMSVAIVVMTDNTTNPNYPEYHWEEKARSVILSSFFWGYVITQVPAGQLAQKFGAKLVVFWGLTICSILAILTPICAEIGGSALVIALRVIQGLCQGTVFPSTHTLVAKWAPLKERGRLGTISYSGAQFGTAVMLAVSGELASSSMGWPSIFYASGGMGLVWAVLWFFFASSSPSENRFVSEEEKAYIEWVPTIENSEPKSAQKLSTPWKSIFTSMPFLVLLLSHCSNNWGFWTLLTEMPTYMKNILDLNIKDSAILSSLPYWGMFGMCFVFVFISELLNRNPCMSLSFSRKFFNSLGLWVPMIGLIGMGYMNKDHVEWAVVLLTLTVSMNAACYLGFQMNHIDLSPNYAGTLMGITNGAANIMSIIAPLLVGFIVTDEKNPSQWRIIFFIAAAVYLVGNSLFIAFGKVETQPWNEPKKSVTNGQTSAQNPTRIIVVESRY
ncbi:putative inorganic phosphate cotransporter [Episyrphus balteatus]|uniref:putative inorganic phosphate cotransporter n=1 Tax=Episyrphus balteatus TaxID=286459 RepID=UPI002486AFF5|nr:putative inorganic phosphate cotransporter [Episyrphus balteatus]